MPRIIRSFFHKRSRFLIIFSLLVVAVLAIVGPAIAPYDPLDVQLKEKLSPPSARHLLGTDNLGRDTFSRIIVATRVSLGTGLMILAISATVGAVLGMISGYYGGWLDEIMMRITDIFLAFPSLVLALAIAAVLGPSLRNAMLAISVTWWPWYARLVRGEVLSIREEEYIMAAYCLGIPTWRIGLFHILPNIIVPVVVQVAMDMGAALVTASGLSFIGLGVQPPRPEWGAMISEGRDYVFAAWWMAVFPGLAIFGNVYLFNVLGDTINTFVAGRDVVG